MTAQLGPEGIPPEEPDEQFSETAAGENSDVIPDDGLAASIARAEEALQRFRDTNPIVDLRDGQPDLDFTRGPLHREDGR